jgi:VWFA-related protein
MRFQLPKPKLTTIIRQTALSRRGAFFAAALALLAVPPSAAGQQDRPAFRSGTRLIEVSVVVTSRDNKPITGLTADDFQIFDDRKLQKAELFSVETGTSATPPSARPIRPAREFSNDVGDIGGVTIILFDQLNASDSVRMYARQHLLRFLEQIGPDDRVGLYVLDGMGVLRVLHEFTSDAGALVRAIAGLRGTLSQPLAAEEDAARLQSDLAALLEDGEHDSGTREMRQHFQGNSATWTVDALESVGHHLAGIRSRKNLIFVSAAFPLSAFAGVGRSAVAEINRATRSLNDANVALYAVDARGLLPTFTGIPGRQIVTTLSMVQANQDIMQSVSEKTGGRAFINTNDIQGAIRRAADDARVSYVLGYYPADDRADGRFHRITVKVNRPGVEVRHREGYFAPATSKQADAQRRDALNAAVVSPIDARGLNMTVRIDPVAGRPAEYRVALRLQSGAIGLERRAGESRGAVDVIVAQVRADGAEGRSLDRRVDISIPDERLPEFQRDGVSLDHTFTLVPSASRVRVVVRDVRSGAVGAIGVSREQLQAILQGR